MLSPDERQRDFPALTGKSYLNTAAESIPPVSALAAYEAYWRDKLGGMAGRAAHFAQVEECRDVSARWLGLKPSEIGFCSCSSEAYNLLASALQLGTADDVVVTDLDFPAGATPWLRAPSQPRLKLWKARDGALDPRDLELLLKPSTRLVQVSLVSFYNGHRIDWKPLLQRVRSLAPRAVLSVDVTQALGRLPLDCAGADVVISSTHKWALGIHGGCIVGVPDASAERVTTTAGGWLHLANAFEADRFERAIVKPGAASFSVGMPNFVALYVLNASLRYLETIGIRRIAAHADPLTARVDAGLRELGVTPLAPWNPGLPSGIVSFRHERSAEIHDALLARHVHIMHHAGRLRMAVHGYNGDDDIDLLLDVLRGLLRKPATAKRKGGGLKP